MYPDPQETEFPMHYLEENQSRSSNSTHPLEARFKHKWLTPPEKPSSTHGVQEPTMLIVVTKEQSGFWSLPLLPRCGSFAPFLFVCLFCLMLSNVKCINYPCKRDAFTWIPSHLSTVTTARLVTHCSSFRKKDCIFRALIPPQMTKDVVTFSVHCQGQQDKRCVFKWLLKKFKLQYNYLA